MAQELKWYFGDGTNGPVGAYASHGDFGDPRIADKPNVTSLYDSGAWRDPTQQEIDDEKDIEVDRELDNLKLLKAVVIWAAQHLNVAPAVARTEIKTIYKGL